MGWAVSMQPPWSMATSTMTAPFFILRDHGAGDDLGRGGAGDEDAADDEVGLGGGALDVVGVGGEGEDACREDVVELAEAVEVEVEQRDLGAHAEGDLGGVGADDAAADDADVAGRDAGDAAEQDAAAAVLLFEVGRADLDGEAAGDLGHGGEEGKRAGAVADGLVGDAGDLFSSRASVRSLERGEVEVGEEDEAFAEVLVLLFDGLLDLDDHVGEAPDVVGGRRRSRRRRPGSRRRGWRRARRRCASTSTLWPASTRALDAGGGNADAALVVFDFLGYTDNHASLRFQMLS